MGVDVEGEDNTVLLARGCGEGVACACGDLGRGDGLGVVKCELFEPVCDGSEGPGSSVASEKTLKLREGICEEGRIVVGD